MEAVALLMESANLSLDDVTVVDKVGVTAAKRWTLRFAGRDARHAALRAGLLLAALRDDSVWKKIEVKALAGEVVPLYVAADKNPKTVRTEVASKRFVEELRKRLPNISWRLQREEGIVSVGYQQVVKVEAESNSRVELRFNDPAVRDNGLTRQALQEVWDAVSSDVSVRGSSEYSCWDAGGQTEQDLVELECSIVAALSVGSPETEVRNHREHVVYVSDCRVAGDAYDHSGFASLLRGVGTHALGHCVG